MTTRSFPWLSPQHWFSTPLPYTLPGTTHVIQATLAEQSILVAALLARAAGQARPAEAGVEIETEL